MLTSRQERILCKVVDEYLQSGQPVASRSIAADPELDCGPSTVRNELALLEELGLLAHPHVRLVVCPQTPVIAMWSIACSAPVTGSSWSVAWSFR